MNSQGGIKFVWPSHVPRRFTLETPEQIEAFLRETDYILHEMREKRRRNGLHHFLDDQDESLVDLPSPLPCPFCGGSLIRISVVMGFEDPEPFCEASCDRCGATEGGGHTTVESAASHWQGRHDS